MRWIQHLPQRVQRPPCGVPFLTLLPKHLRRGKRNNVPCMDNPYWHSIGRCTERETKKRELKWSFQEMASLKEKLQQLEDAHNAKLIDDEMLKLIRETVIKSFTEQPCQTCHPIQTYHNV